MYEEDSDDSWGGPGSDDEHEHGSDCEHDHGHGAAPASAEPQGEQRAALEAILDDFLQKYEVIGGKYRPQLEGTGDDKVSRLDRLRNELANLNLDAGEDDEAVARRKEKERIMAIVERQYDEEANRTRKGGKDNWIQGVTIIEDNYRDRWDCETVLSASRFSLRGPAAARTLTLTAARYLLELVEPPADAPPARRLPRTQTGQDHDRSQDGIPARRWQECARAARGRRRRYHHGGGGRGGRGGGVW